jgi:CelD/BcsL family acetyltransferase involved in cellulose biosynthesis
MIDCQLTCDPCLLLECDGPWRVQLHTGDEALDRLQPEWDRLLAASDADWFFPHSAWQRIWWRHFGGEHLLRLITVRDDSGHLLGIAPLMAARQEPCTLQFIGGTEVADYLDLIVDRQRSGELRTVLFEALRSHLPWDILDLHCLPSRSETPSIAEQALAEHGIGTERLLEDVCPSVHLRGSWDGYLAGLSKKDRHELRRKLRRAVDDLGAEWRTVATPADLEPALDAFFALHRSSGPAKAAFMTAAMAGYFRDLAAETLARGWLRLGVLWAGQIPVSAAMGFAYGDRLYLYNSGYDPAYSSHSAGIAAVGLLLRDVANEGLAVFDFLQGNESYKYTLGAEDDLIFQVVARRAV